jgi:hypothetical protein
VLGRLSFVCAEYNTKVMRLFRLWQCARITSLVVTAGLLFLGVFLFLSWTAAESELSAALTMTDSSHAEHAAKGSGHPIGGNYLTGFADEEKAKDKLPANAVQLRALLLVVLLGMALWWLLGSGWTRTRLQVLSHIRCWLHSIACLRQRRPVAARLGVFRL